MIPIMKVEQGKIDPELYQMVQLYLCKQPWKVCTFKVKLLPGELSGKYLAWILILL